MATPSQTPAPFSGWRPASFSQSPSVVENGLDFRMPGARLAVTAISRDVIRVRFSPTPEFGRDHSYAIVGQPPEKPDAVATAGDGESVLTTGALKVVVHHTPLRLAFLDREGRVLDEDEPTQGIAWAGTRVQVAKRLPDDANIYGFGEKTGRLNKRGWCLGGYSYAMWTTDTYAYDVSTDPLYVSVPFYLGLREGRAYGIFLDNTHRSFFDVGRQQNGVLTFGAEGGELNYYFINGPHPRDVLARYAALTGRAPLPPRWAMGYHQSRWSYYPESRVRLLAETFREKRIPADVIWLDVHCLDGYAPLTWDPERFPDPKKLAADLRARGFRLVPIVDPHLKAEAGHAPYESGVAGGHLIKNADGTVYTAPVWPSQAEKNPRQSVFPDFTRAATRAWWGELLKEISDLGVGGVWNDMNEPSVFKGVAKTMPLDLQHDHEGAGAPHAAVHNVYGQLQSRASYEGLRRLRPDERAFVLTRASFAGGQRYAAVWTGDNTSDWSHLQQSLPMLLGLGVSGFPFVGADIGGFCEVPSAELFTRWLQAGVFYPFMRAHTQIGTPDQEPWSYGEAHERLNRRAIELRYELLPHLYSVMAESLAAGLPAMRPLFLEYPTDEKVRDTDDQFLFGRDLLVAPVVKEALAHRGVYLPTGDWYDFWTGVRVKGGDMNYFPVTLESLPIYVRAGGFVFRQPVVQHTGEMAALSLTVEVYPGAASETIFYEDDGESTACERGVFARRKLTQAAEGGTQRVEFAAVEGEYRPPQRELILRVRRDAGAPSSVTLNGRKLRRDAEWRWTDAGFIELTWRDAGDAMTVVAMA